MSVYVDERYTVKIEQQTQQVGVELLYSRWKTDNRDVVEKTSNTSILLNESVGNPYITEPMVLLSIATKSDGNMSKIVTTPCCPSNMVGFNPKTDLSQDIPIFDSSYNPFPKYVALDSTIVDMDTFMGVWNEAKFETLILPKTVVSFNKHLLDAFTIDKLILQYDIDELVEVINKEDNQDFFESLKGHEETTIYFKNKGVCNVFEEFMPDLVNRIFVFDKYIDEYLKDPSKKLPDITA